MLMYSDIKDILYNSKYYKQISLDLEESPPIFCSINNDLFILFVYYDFIADDINWMHKIILRKAIAIDIDAGHVLYCDDMVFFSKAIAGTKETKFNIYDFKAKEYINERNLYEAAFEGCFNSRYFESLKNTNRTIKRILGLQFYNYFVFPINQQLNF